MTGLIGSVSREDYKVAQIPLPMAGVNPTRVGKFGSEIKSRLNYMKEFRRRSEINKQWLFESLICVK
jgi:hypothetical protein